MIIFDNRNNKLKNNVNNYQEIYLKKNIKNQSRSINSSFKTRTQKTETLDKMQKSKQSEDNINRKNYSNINCIDFIYSISLDRIDHTLCNILLLKQIPLNVNSKIITLNQEIYLIRNKIEFLNKKNRTLSIIPLTFVENIKTNGLKWELNNVNLQFGFIGGISNIIEKDNASICLNKGECIVILNIN